MTEQDCQEFLAYLRNCTDSQVRGVYEKELAAGRVDYAQLAKSEAQQRGVEL